MKRRAQVCVSAAFVATRLVLRMIDLCLLVFPWSVLSWILPFPEGTIALFAQHTNVVLIVLLVVTGERFCFPSNAPSDVVVVLAFGTGSNLSSGKAAEHMELWTGRPGVSATLLSRCSREPLSPIVRLLRRRGRPHLSGWTECTRDLARRRNLPER